MDRMSQLLIPTLRQEPSAPADPGLRRLLRGGYLRLDKKGRPLLLPLGLRLLQRVQAALEGALQAASGQALLPAAMAQERLANGIAPIMDLLARELRSYRALPKLLYASATAPIGPTLLSIALGIPEQPAPEPLVILADALERMGLGAEQARALPPDDRARQGMALTQATPEHGQEILACPQCSYRALAEAAGRRKEPPAPEDPLPLTPVETPGAHTIAALAQQLGLPPAKTAKAMFYVAEGLAEEQGTKVVVVLLRGDMELNEHKLRRALGARALRLASEDEIQSVGATPGYGSPIGVQGAIVVVDDLIPHCPNLVAGANREGFHLLHANYGRDFQAHIVADLVQPAAGDPCPQCGAPLAAQRAVRLAQAWSYSAAAAAQAGWTVAGPEGKPVGIALSAAALSYLPILGALAIIHGGEDGLAWPPALAPYPLHLILLPGAEGAWQELAPALDGLGLAWLVDDRDERAGVKFNDADWVGAPLRLLLGRRSLQAGGVEARLDGQRQGEIVPLPAVPQWVQEQLQLWGTPAHP